MDWGFLLYEHLKAMPDFSFTPPLIISVQMFYVYMSINESRIWPRDFNALYQLKGEDLQFLLCISLNEKIWSNKTLGKFFQSSSVA